MNIYMNICTVQDLNFGVYRRSTMCTWILRVRANASRNGITSCFRVQGLGFRVQGSGFRVRGEWSGVRASGFGV